MVIFALTIIHMGAVMDIHMSISKMHLVRQTVAVTAPDAADRIRKKRTLHF